MLPTFVIGLREGLEASLIVGIIAAFLRKQGRKDLLRWVWLGVGTATTLCIAVGVVLAIVSRDLPQRQQEGLETVVGILAVAMVSYMVVWMRRHSRELKGTLEEAAAAAMESGSSRAGRAMVLMAFLAVLREGFETVVFLLAAFNETGNGLSPILGAVFGILVAVALGWGIYRGGVRLNLSKFFRATGLVLVFVAAGLVVTAFHTAHEAGWLNAGQGQTFSLNWLVHPGSVQSSLLTGILGVQPHPVVIEVVSWLVYAVPMALYVAWPPGRGLGPRRTAVVAAVGAVGAAVACAAVAVTAPAAPAVRPVTSASGSTAQVISAHGTSIGVRLTSTGTAPMTATVHRSGTAVVDGLTLDRYTSSTSHPSTTLSTQKLSVGAIAKLNAGRLPLGLDTVGVTRYPVSYNDVTSTAAAVDPQTLRIVTFVQHHRVTATVSSKVGSIPLSVPVKQTTSSLPATATATAVAALNADVSVRASRDDRRDIAIALGVLTLLLAVGAYRSRRQAISHPPPTSAAPAPALAGHAGTT